MKKIFLLFTLLLGFILAYIIPSYAPGKGSQDYIRYWAASRLLITGGNPYDSHEMTALQKETQPNLMINEGDIVEAWNPPWLLLALSPFGIFPFRLAVPAWIFMNILLIMIALTMSWHLSGGNENLRVYLIAIGAGFLFGNTIILIRLGQITALVLLSLLVGFWLIQKERDWLAGCVLLISTIKPHLSYFVLLVLLLWILKHHRWKILAGMVSAGVLSAMIVWILLPNWLSIYLETILRLPFTNIFTSTLGSFMGEVFGLSFFKYIAILLLPIAFPLAKKIDQLGWFTIMNLSLVLSIPLSIYGFSFDQVLLLPAIIQIIIWISKEVLPRIISWGLIIDMLITYSILLWMMSLPSLAYYWYFWISFSILCLYLLACKFYRIGIRSA